MRTREAIAQAKRDGADAGRAAASWYRCRERIPASHPRIAEEGEGKLKIEIHISTDGAAFEENGAAVEVARIVREIAWDVENMGESFGTTKYRLLFDVNGNACGHIDYIGKP